MGAFLRILKWLWENRERLLPMLESLLPVLQSVGANMETAGNGTSQASKFVGGRQAEPVNAQDVLASVAQMLTQSKRQLSQAATQIEEAANFIGAVKVPTVAPETSRLHIPSILGTPEINMTVVTGLDIGDTALFQPVSDALRDGAGKLRDVCDGLQQSASTLSSISGVCGGAGDLMFTVGQNLVTGGQALKQLQA